MLFNKIFGAVLAVLLAILGIKTLSDVTFGKGGHHGGHHGEEEHSMNEQLAQNFAYYIELPDGGEGHGGEEEVVVFDLGLELASADIAKGEKSFRSKCSSCHTADEGGANGTGPNLHDVVGRPIGSHEGFGYSGGMGDYAAANGNWDYEHLNAFLTDPKGTVSGTAMAFAGLRKDPERMNVIAYLASINPVAPAFPAPLPAEEEHASDAAPGVEGDLAEAETPDMIAPEGLLETVEGAVDSAEEAAHGAMDALQEAATDAEDKAQDVVEEHGGH